MDDTNTPLQYLTSTGTHYKTFPQEEDVNDWDWWFQEQENALIQQRLDWENELAAANDKFEQDRCTSSPHRNKYAIYSRNVRLY